MTNEEAKAKIAALLSPEPFDMSFEWRPQDRTPKVGSIVLCHFGGMQLKARVESISEDEETGETTYHMVGIEEAPHGLD